MMHSSDALRRPRVFGGVAGRAARALVTAFSALALAVGAVAVAPSSARADDTITTQDYFRITSWIRLARRDTPVRV